MPQKTFFLRRPQRPKKTSFSPVTSTNLRPSRVLPTSPDIHQEREGRQVVAAALGEAVAAEARETAARVPAARPFVPPHAPGGRCREVVARVHVAEV